MFNIGLFLNDLSLHDASRDLVLVGNHKSAELKIALDQVRFPMQIQLEFITAILISFVFSEQI